MSMILLGALLVLAGVIFIAIQVLRAGRLSSAKPSVGQVPRPLSLAVKARF